MVVAAQVALRLDRESRRVSTTLEEGIRAASNFGVGGFGRGNPNIGTF